MTARQRSIALIYNALRYLVLTYRMDNEWAADIDREGSEDEEKIVMGWMMLEWMGWDGIWHITKHPVIEG